MWTTIFVTRIILFSGILLSGTAAQTFNCATVPTPTNTICLPQSQLCLDNSLPPSRGLADSTIENFILAQHNVRRARVASGTETQGLPGPQLPSQCMAKLSWSTELAATAQRWADQCVLNSDTNRNRNLAGDAYVGQNAFAWIDPFGTPFNRTSPEIGYWEQAINSWYDQVRQFSSATVNSYAYSAATGHYTQMVWGRTVNVGCGFRRWNLANNAGYARIMVCNYWPGGNQVGAAIYQTTATGVSCNTTTCASPAQFQGRTMNGNGFLCE